MSVSRRALLITGASAVVIAGGVWSATRDPKAARAPWRQASKGFGDPRLDCLAYAILAPNPHNMQPWRIRLEGDNALTIFCDPGRLLPETDPPNRQSVIGFGAFLELLRQAAAEKGYRAVITPFPEGEPQPVLDTRPIAHVVLVEDAGIERDPLFDDVLQRRTNRSPFDLKRIPAAHDLSALASAADASVATGFSADPALVTALRDLTVAAWRTEWNNAPTRKESIEVTRIGKKQNNTAPYGLSLTGAGIDAAAAAGVLTAKRMDEPGAVAFEQTIDFYIRACETATAYIWINTAVNSRIDQLNSGRAWVRIQLTAAANGVGFHPLSQALQEFPAMAAHYRRVHELLAATNGETVQMLARLGYPTQKAPPAPREPLLSKLVEL